MPSAVGSLSYLSPRLPALCLLVSRPPPSLSSFICFHMLSRHVSLPCSSTGPPSFLICPPFLHARSHFPTSSSLFLPSPVLLPIGSSRSLTTWAYICTSRVVNRDSAGPYFVSVSVCVCVLYTCMYVCGTSRRGCLWATLACVSCCFSQFC